MPRNRKDETTAWHIVGAEPVGITDQVARTLGGEIKAAYRKVKGREVQLQGMRFSPSSRVDIGDGQFQILANTIVEVAGVGGRPSRSEAIESVVTIDGKQRNQSLKNVKIPAFLRFPTT